MSDRRFNIIAALFFIWMACAFVALFSTDSDIRDALAFVDGIRKVSGK